MPQKEGLETVPRPRAVIHRIRARAAQIPDRVDVIPACAPCGLPFRQYLSGSPEPSAGGGTSSKRGGP